MARHITITDEQILEAARAVFLEEGFAAPTAKIARLAGVSEGSIFKRFPTKEALFLAALNIPYPPPWHRMLEELVGSGDLKDNLVTVSGAVLTHFRDMLPRMITQSGNRIGPPDPATMATMDDPPPLRDVRMLDAFLCREVALGRLRDCNTEFVAQVLCGTLSSYIFTSVLARRERTAEACRAFARGVVELLWDGIKPDASTAK